MDPTLTAAAIGVGGTVIVGVAGFWANVRNTNKSTALTLRAIEVTEQEQVTDRYSKAVEQLGSENLDVRIGGIYALERVARDSAQDHPAVMEVLTAFIREHSREQWPRPATDSSGADAYPRAIRRDVQAALKVIGRRDTRQDREHIDLIGAHLPYADLRGADLSGAALNHANLIRAQLSDANLAHAELFDANLAGADLIYTNLTGANLFRAILNRALLAGAILTGARLAGVDLTDSMVSAAHITRRSTTTIAEKADFTGADLSDVAWPSHVVVPEGWQRDPTSGRLKQAGTNSGEAPTDPAPAA